MHEGCPPDEDTRSFRSGAECPHDGTITQLSQRDTISRRWSVLALAPPPGIARACPSVPVPSLRSVPDDWLIGAADNLVMKRSAGNLRATLPSIITRLNVQSMRLQSII